MAHTIDIILALVSIIGFMVGPVLAIYTKQTFNDWLNTTTIVMAVTLGNKKIMLAHIVSAFLTLAAYKYFGLVISFQICLTMLVLYYALFAYLTLSGKVKEVTL